jgi:hypothetical protein
MNLYLVDPPVDSVRYHREKLMSEAAQYRRLTALRAGRRPDRSALSLRPSRRRRVVMRPECTTC